MLRPALLGHGLPPNHVLGGLNVSFWPIGPITRRSSYVFIRRQFRGDDVYRWTLQQYMTYLVRKRFNIEWYIEGGRSRTGKLRPPRYGILSYLVDGMRAEQLEDAYIVPTSITYEQLHEVGDMAAQARGGTKTKEDLPLAGRLRALAGPRPRPGARRVRRAAVAARVARGRLRRRRRQGRRPARGAEDRVRGHAPHQLASRP